MKIAFIGLGNMGGGMAANLLKNGYAVRAFDLSEDALARAEGHGATRAASAIDAVAGADAVVTMLPAGRAIPGDADLVILPGSKSTRADLDFLRRQGWDIDLAAHRRRGGRILGICGGYQMLGKEISDPDGVESTQAQIQRRMQVFRTAGLTDDPSVILEDICSSINNQKRPDRGNLTPLQLLKLNKEERGHINAMYRDRTHIPEVKGLRELRPGHHVRLLLMTFKEQVQNKTKGFAPKWSRDIFTVRKKQSLQGNPEHYRYFLHGEQESYFRHELLWVPKNVDTEIVDGYVVHQEQLIAEDFSDYDPEEDS